MLQNNVPPPTELGEITVTDIRHQDFEQALTRSNWCSFFTSEQPPVRGEGRSDDDETTPTR